MKTAQYRTTEVPPKAREAFLALMNKRRISRLLLGVSGGPDSVFLLQVALACRGCLQTLHVAHLNHQLRGKDSDRDSAFVEKLAQSHQLPVHIQQVVMTNERGQAVNGSEASGRKARQHFFAEVLTNNNLQAVALAHTLDDQAETVLLHLTRGAGPTGLSGMREDTSIALPSGESLRILRPLLAIPKPDILVYLDSNEIPYCTDHTNHSLKFSRNRLRHKVLPELEKINPKTKQALARTATLLQQQQDKAMTILHKIAEETVLAQSEDLIELSLEKLAKHPPADQSSLIEHLLRTFLGEPDNLSWQHIDQIIDLITLPASGKAVSLPQGACAVSTDQTLRLHRTLPNVPAPTAVTIDVPGRSCWGSWRISADITTTQQDKFDKDRKDYSASIQLDAGKLEPDRLAFAIRSWQAGDRIKPLGMSQHRKLQDFFTDRKVPRHDRQTIPLIELPNGTILCVGSLTLHDDYKITPDTKRFLTISFKKDKPDGQA